MNNLKQLGLAIQGYHDVNAEIPPTSNNGTPDWSMKGRLLPFLEQTVLFNALNVSFNTDNVVNTTVRNTKVNVFLCPSDGSVPNAVTGNTNYPNNMGIIRNAGNAVDGPADKMNQSSDGPDVTFATVTDGLSNTAMWSEFVTGGGQAVAANGRDGKSMTYVTSTKAPDASYVPYGPAAFQKVGQVCQSSAQNPALKYSDVRGQEWLNHQMGWGGAYSHLMTPNKPTCVYDSWHTDSGIITAGSYHPGGVNMAFMDGSVKFVKDSVSPSVWWAIATKAGGEVVSSDGY